MGIALVVIGNGSKYFADMFVEALKFTGDVYRDPDSAIFAAWDLIRFDNKQAKTRFFDPALKSWYQNTIGNQGYKEDMEGDGLQSGAVFGVGAEKDGSMEVFFSFREQENLTNTFAKGSAILSACRDYLPKHSKL